MTYHYYVTWFIDGSETSVLSYFSSADQLALDQIMVRAAQSEDVNLDDITYELGSVLRTTQEAFVIW
jgi:hypothetical protein